MSKKKLEKMLRKALKKEIGSRRNGAAEYEDDASGAGSDGDAGRNGSGRGGKGRRGAGGIGQQGLLGSLGLPRGFGAGTTEQFIVGALLGAAAAYVLADEELRGKIMKSVLRLYTGLAGSVEEFKEQMADVRAEIEAEGGA